MKLARLVAPALFALLSSAALAQMDPGATSRGQPIRITPDSAASRVVAFVHQSQFGYVRIETREPGAPPNAHPMAIDETVLRATLERIQLPGANPEPVFSKRELDELAAPLAVALARATPEQDVSFAVSDRHSFMGPLAMRDVTTGRVFRSERGLEIIFGLVRKDFESQFRGSGYLIPFEPGQRAKPVASASRVSLPAGAGSQLRPDWITVSLDAAQKPAAAPAPAAGAVAAPPPPVGAVAAPAPAQPSPAAPPMAAPPPAAQPPAATRTPDDIAKSVAERLSVLQKLRDRGVITEQEYQERRRAILSEI
jgi:hypothetical protein